MLFSLSRIFDFISGARRIFTRSKARNSSEKSWHNFTGYCDFLPLIPDPLIAVWPVSMRNLSATTEIPDVVRVCPLPAPAEKRWNAIVAAFHLHSFAIYIYIFRCRIHNDSEREHRCRISRERNTRFAFLAAKRRPREEKREELER